MRGGRLVRHTLRGVLLLGVAWMAAVAFLVFREPALVYPGAGWRLARQIVPADQTSLPWDSVRILADDGVPVFLLESRIADGDERPWLLFFHGNGGLVGSAGSVGRYQLFREAGFNVLAVEYRGYGASVGDAEPSEEGLYADARAAWTYLTRSLNVDPAQVVPYGWSLGSGLATYIADEMAPAAVVTEGAPTSLPDVGAALYPWVPVRLLMRNRFDNLERATRLRLPWLLFHGRSDAEVPPVHGRVLAAAASDSRLVELEAGHDGGVLAGREVALAALKELGRHVSGVEWRDEPIAPTPGR